MTEYVCTKCGKSQYTAKTNDQEPCIYCGGKVEKK